MSKNTNFLSLFFTGVMVLITFFGYSASKTENEIVVLNENDRVKFDVEQGDRGPKAVNVELDKE